MLQTARVQWEEGDRRVEAARSDTTRYRQLGALVDTVVDELRRRVGQSYTLDDLAGAYDRSEDWVREVVTDALPARRARVGVGDSVAIGDAAVARYARGAVDYSP